MDIPHIKHEILMQLPMRFRTMAKRLDFLRLQEIRFRCGRPVMAYFGEGGCMVTESGELTQNTERAMRMTAAEMASLLAAFCENSVYAYQHEICDGFLTIRGGHRVGISGRCVLSDGKITNVTEISGLNLRIAKEFIGCAEDVLPQILREDGSVANTILLAPPQCGKTTVLRDLARLLSAQQKVTIVDERSELAAVKGGIPQFLVGMQTDVLDRFPKAQGMLAAIRSLSPEVIITDELGGAEDIAAVKSVLNAGCRIITSMHGDCAEELVGERRALFSLFERAVVLTRRRGVPEITQVLRIGGQAVEEAEKC